MSRKPTFPGGIYPAEQALTPLGAAVETLPPPPRVAIPLQKAQACTVRPVVATGDRVKIGYVLAQPLDDASVPAHASVAGTVVAVRPLPHPTGRLVLCAEIENDGSDAFVDMKSASSWRETTPSDLCNAIARAGIVDLGGSGLPVHTELTGALRSSIEMLVVNAVGSEPGDATAYRLFADRCERVIAGTSIVARITNARRIVVAVSDRKKSDAIDALNAQSSGFRETNGRFEIAVFRPKYPQDDHRLVVHALSGREIPAGGTAADAGCLVLDPATLAAIADAIVDGTPLYQRLVSVTGPAVGTPKNLLVRTGTPIRAILDHCAINWAKTTKVTLGGMLRGQTVSDPLMPFVESASCVCALTDATPARGCGECIHCGSCGAACPMHLVPSSLAQYAGARRLDDTRRLGIDACIECGCCSYVCPAKINLVHYMQLARHHARCSPVYRAGYTGFPPPMTVS